MPNFTAETILIRNKHLDSFIKKRSLQANLTIFYNTVHVKLVFFLNLDYYQVIVTDGLLPTQEEMSNRRLQIHWFGNLN